MFTLRTDTGIPALQFSHLQNTVNKVMGFFEGLTETIHENLYHSAWPDTLLKVLK